MRNILFILSSLFLLFPASLYAQTSTDNVTLEQTSIDRNGTTFIIGYILGLSSEVQTVDVALEISVDGGRNFSSDLLGGTATGDVGLQNISGPKTIYYDFASIKENLAGKQLAFRISIVSKTMAKKPNTPAESDAFVLVSAGFFPQTSFGLMGGYVKKFGFYVKGRSNFSSMAPEYECASDGKTSFGYIWTSGKQAKSRLTVTGGLLMRATNNIFPYIGGGYGNRAVCWEDSQGQWAKVSDYSCSGVAIDAGIIFKIGPVAVSIGVNNTAFRYTDIEAGFGISF